MKKVVEKEEEIILITKTSKGLSWKEYHFIHEDFSLRESEFFQKQKFMQRKKEIFILFFRTDSSRSRSRDGVESEICGHIQRI